MIDRLARGLVAALAAAAALAAPPVAAARPPSCVTRAQLGTLTHALWPVVVDQALTRCAAVLPPDAYLVRAADTLRARFPSSVASDVGAVRRAVEGIAGGPMPGADDATIARLFTGKLVEKFGLTRLTAGQCRDASEILEPLDTLAPAEFERLLVRVFAVAGRKNRDFTICEAESAPPR